MASYERTLEDALEAEVEALTYIAANSVPVLNWDDQSADRVLPCVTVRVQPRQRIAPNADYYILLVEVVAYRHRGDDANQTVQDAIYDDLATWAQALTAAGLSVDGIVNGAGIDETNEDYHYRGVTFEVYDTIA